MSLILCPECGTKISYKATIYPHCGNMSDDHSRPISEQESCRLPHRDSKKSIGHGCNFWRSRFNISTLGTKHFINKKYYAVKVE